MWERGGEREGERERDGRVSQRMLTYLQLFLGIAFLRFDWIGFWQIPGKCVKICRFVVKL